MGKIILIGGKLDTGIVRGKATKKTKLRNIHPYILERFLREMRGVRSRIEIITSASGTPIKEGHEYKRALKKLKCKNTGFMYLRDPEQADRKEHLDRLEACDGLIFTGGDQIKICKGLLKSKFLEIMKKRFNSEENFMVAGTSAGAMAMSEIIIARGKPAEALKKGTVKLQEGLGLLPQIIIDTHFINRERFGRLLEAVAGNPQKLGIGLGENTAVFFKKTHHVETIGANLVVLMDGSHLTVNNIDKIDKGQLICLENINLHILPQGHMFNINRRRVYKKTVRR